MPAVSAGPSPFESPYGDAMVHTPDWPSVSLILVVVSPISLAAVSSAVTVLPGDQAQAGLFSEASPPTTPDPSIWQCHQVWLPSSLPSASQVLNAVSRAVSVLAVAVGWFR